MSIENESNTSEWCEFITGQTLEEFLQTCLDSHIKRMQEDIAKTMLDESFHGFVRVKDI